MEKTTDPKILLRRLAAFALVAVGFVGFKLAQGEPVSAKQKEVATVVAAHEPEPAPIAVATPAPIVEQSAWDALPIPTGEGAIEFKPGGEDMAPDFTEANETYRDEEKMTRDEKVTEAMIRALDMTGQDAEDFRLLRQEADRLLREAAE